MIAQYDDKDKLLKGDLRSSRIQVSQTSRESWEKFGFGLSFSTPVLPGAARFRLIECDEQSGATGSVTIPIKSLVADSH